MPLRIGILLLSLSLVLVPSTLLGQASLGIKIDASGTVTELARGGAGDKAGIKVGDTITGLNNHSLTQGTAEIQATLAKTRAGSLLPVTIRRAGHPMTLLAFPQAAADLKAASSPGISAATGHYTCFTFTFSAGQLAETVSSLSTGIDLLPRGEYVALGKNGRFHSDPATDRLSFDSGPLAGSVAHLQRDTNGKPKIAFLQNENRHAIDGHEIDHGPTACSLKN